MSATLIQLEAAPDLVERVYGTLYEAISTGALAPGQRLTQEEIAQQLAVSRQPVLQALRLLKKDGFVQDAPGRGLQVTPLDVTWTRNVYQVRGALDALAARLAAERRYQMDPALLERGRAAAAGGEVTAMIDADLAFHVALYAAAGNPLIEQSAQAHWRHLRRVMGAVLRDVRQREAVWDEHAAIAQAIAAGDGERAARLAEDHGRQAGEMLAARLEDVLRTPDPHNTRRPP